MPELTDINQIPGIFRANAQDASAGTGCTVIICPKGATGAVDVRGGAPQRERRISCGPSRPCSDSTLWSFREAAPMVLLLPVELPMSSSGIA